MKNPQTLNSLVNSFSKEILPKVIYQRAKQIAIIWNRPETTDQDLENHILALLKFIGEEVPKLYPEVNQPKQKKNEKV